MYVLVLAIIAGYALLIALLARWELPIPVEIAIFMFCFLSVFSVLGGVLYERRHELGLETWASPERTQERRQAQDLRQSDRDVAEAYGQMRAGSHTRAWEQLQTWLASRGHATGGLPLAVRPRRKLGRPPLHHAPHRRLCRPLADAQAQWRGARRGGRAARGRSRHFAPNPPWPHCRLPASPPPPAAAASASRAPCSPISRRVLRATPVLPAAVALGAAAGRLAHQSRAGRSRTGALSWCLIAAPQALST